MSIKFIFFHLFISICHIMSVRFIVSICFLYLQVSSFIRLNILPLVFCTYKFHLYQIHRLHWILSIYKFHVYLSSPICFFPSKSFISIRFIVVSTYQFHVDQIHHLYLSVLSMIFINRAECTLVYFPPESFTCLHLYPSGCKAN